MAKKKLKPIMWARIPFEKSKDGKTTADFPLAQRGHLVLDCKCCGGEISSVPFNDGFEAAIRALVAADFRCQKCAAGEG